MALLAKNITVSFPGVKALSNVSVEFKPGRVHAVLGANGSGKSTLVKVLTGVYHPDKGHDTQIVINDTKVNDIENPSRANDLGIRVVHQETPLIDTFTVAECVALFKGYPKNKVNGIDWKTLYQYVEELFEVYNINIAPNTLTTNLKASERNMIAMAIAIGKGEELQKTKALILDEADASLPEAEAEVFLNHVRKIADMGIPVVMVTHRLKEVRKLCDDITILNGGEVVFSGEAVNADDDFIISKMIKLADDNADADQDSQKKLTLQHLWDLLKKRPREKTSEPVLEFENVCAPNINGLSFSLYGGEILGFVGIPDSGICELPLVLGGDMRRKSGKYLVDKREVSINATPRKAFRRGVTVLPCDRIKRGGIMSCSLRENVLMPNEMQYWHRKKLVKDVMGHCIEIFDINPGHDINMEFGKFSGGNQQKAILAKWLSVCPTVFVLDDPTYGVDPASRIKVFDAIRSAADKNVGIILFSTEPEQLADICTRLLVLQHGKVVCELTQADKTLTREEVARWWYA